VKVKADKIAIVAALERELRPLRRKIGKGAIYLVTGMSKEGVMRELPRFIERHRPEIIILTGFAGGLQPGLESGVLLLATALQHESAHEGISLENRFFVLAAAALEAAQIPFQRGKLLTVDRIVGGPEEKNRLWKDFSASAVDMEAWWATQVVDRPMICLKAILDPAGEALPWGLASAVAVRSQRWDWGWALSRALGEWPELLRLARAAKRATGALAEAIACVITALARSQTQTQAVGVA